MNFEKEQSTDDDAKDNSGSSGISKIAVQLAKVAATRAVLAAFARVCR